MIPIRTARLVLRNWRECDRPLFHRINSDERVMEFFPFRRDRAASDAVMDRMRTDIETDGFGRTAVERIEDGACIGFVGVRVAEIGPVVPAGSMEIGWRLDPEFWDQGYVMEAAAAWLDAVFGKLGRDEIVSFAAVDNRRSTAVMERLGMRRDADFDHPRVPDSHPDLKRYALYRLMRTDWRR